MFDSLFPKHWTTLQRLMWLKTNALARAVYEIVTGNPVSFTAKAAPLRQLSVAFSPVQSGTGDPSPDNVRPISGWDGVTVEQYGANLADPDALVAGYISNSGEIAGQSQTQLEYSSDFIPMPPNTQRITVGYNGYESGEAAWMGVAIYDENKDFIQRSANTTSAWKYTAYVAGRNAAYFRFTARTYGHGLDKMFCGIGDVSEFTPFTGHRTISISLGETVYSGTLDVVTGVVKARPYFASYNGETLVGPWMSSMDKYVAGATPTTGAQVVDMGGTETTIQLTPQEVQSLLGENNMWSDANGDLTVEYRSN